ncbi:MAG TPA: LCP family protein, partial [Ktedonobacteraceae bacterium]|nr:LCP family protein [Ktedonobacteraceae bacterium]
MDDDTTIKLGRPQHIPQLPSAFDGMQEQPYTPVNDKPTIPFKLDSLDDPGVLDNLPPLEYEQTWDNAPSSPDVKSEPASAPQPVPLLPVAPPAPVQKTRKGRRRWPKWVKVVVTIFLILLVLAGGTAVYGFYYFDTNIQQPLQKIIHPVSLGKSEQHLKVQPLPPDTAVTGRSWNILLLGSDNDQKYTFPVILTQVMMVVHIDTVTNSVTMVSIPRDSWVSVPEIGGMHKIDQAFFLGALQHNSFDDGVRVARETIERDYGITIDRYAWVGLNGFANVINTLGGVDVDVTHPIVDDNYPADTGKNANNPYALQRL